MPTALPPRRLRSGHPDSGRSPGQRPARPRPAAPARPSARPGGGTTLTPYDDRPFGELTERYRHPAAPTARPRTAAAGHPSRLRPHHRGLAWLAPAAAVGSLTAGIALAHGLLIAGGLVLAGLWGHLAADGRDPHR
ncbi:hypothetical protein OHT20_34830 [Streptomyces caniferus]|uniref:DUF3040 domain-containing protein n=1 Tax=Streptomyces caniferus TaxID=285557 RepID=A0ABZ1VVZ0_9ACTN|nr:hypothetical protein [Streptomyces caniferus]